MKTFTTTTLFAVAQAIRIKQSGTAADAQPTSLEPLSTMNSPAAGYKVEELVNAIMATQGYCDDSLISKMMEGFDDTWGNNLGSTVIDHEFRRRLEYNDNGRIDAHECADVFSYAASEHVDSSLVDHAISNLEKSLDNAAGYRVKELEKAIKKNEGYCDFWNIFDMIDGWSEQYTSSFEMDFLAHFDFEEV